jgi:hypothetical protein
MQRWRTERVYEDLKNELGLDHFEGRSFAGWHHHVSVALCCFAFIVAERVRHFHPLGPKAVGRLHALVLGLSDISQTASLPSASPWRASSRHGSRAVLPVTGFAHAQALTSS